MAEAIVADLGLFLNRLFDNQCHIRVRLWHLQALLEVCLTTNNFYDVSVNHLHEYFSLVANLVEEIFSLTEENIKELSSLQK